MRALRRGSGPHYPWCIAAGSLPRSPESESMTRSVRRPMPTDSSSCGDQSRTKVGSETTFRHAVRPRGSDNKVVSDPTFFLRLVGQGSPYCLSSALSVVGVVCVAWVTYHSRDGDRLIGAERQSRVARGNDQRHSKN